MTKPMTTEDWKRWIESASHEQLARMYRFAPAGHPLFVRDGELWPLFMRRFKALGGMTTGVSKRIGW